MCREDARRGEDVSPSWGEKARSTAHLRGRPARGYLVHPVLGPRLHECVGLVLGSGAPTAEAIFGSLDAMKLRSSMTVFVRADPDDRSFRAIIDRYFDGRPDPLTDRLLAASSG